jgi:hypothetical protein
MVPLPLFRLFRSALPWSKQHSLLNAFPFATMYIDSGSSPVAVPVAVLLR